MKMNQLYTAIYRDGRVAYEKPQGESGVEIRPTIWLWKAKTAPVYFVDYEGAGIGCTLATFDTLQEAQTFCEKIGGMTAEEFEGWLINVRWKKEA